MTGRVTGRMVELELLADPMVSVEQFQRAGPLERSHHPVEHAGLVPVGPTRPQPGLVRALEQVARPRERRRTIAVEGAADVVVVGVAERSTPTSASEAGVAPGSGPQSIAGEVS